MKSFFRKIRHQTISANLTIPENAFVLDTSCQDGGFLSILVKKNSEKNLKIYGVDLSKEDIKKSETLIPNGIFKVTDNSSLSFPEKTFDVVISSLTLHHMSDPINSIKEMKRVLKDTGSVYLIDIIGGNKIFNFILKHIKCPEPYHFEKFYSLSEAQDLFTKVGLRIEKIDSILVFPTFTIVVPVTVFRLTK